MLASKLEQFWTKVTNIGIDENAMGREVIKNRLLNQLIFIAIVTSILSLFTYLWIFQGMKIIYTTLANISVESIGLFFAFQKRHIVSRYLAGFVFPSLIAIHVLILGGNFGETNIFIALGVASFFLFEGQRRVQISALIYISILFVSSKLYTVDYITAYNSTPANPYDEILTFPMILIVLLLIILIYQAETKKYEAQRLGFIQDLEAKNAELASLNSELEEFTYIASHDLKTPIRSVSSYLDLSKIHLSRKDYDKAEHYLASAKSVTGRMYELVNDILEYKRISQSDTRVGQVDLNQILENIQQKMAPQLQALNGQIVFEKVLPRVTANANEMTAMFQNLIENGLKYNESSHPKVKVFHAIKSTNLYICVQDNGIGIAPEYHDRIFKFFNRLHTPETYEGSGIGLGLCKKIAQKYGGDIQIVSEPGQGSLFWISLPLRILSTSSE